MSMAVVDSPYPGALGYNGSKAAMQLIAQADVVLALGTRLNPFSTLPGYGIDYWPKDAAIIQADINSNRIGITKPVSVGIVGDAAKVASAILGRLSGSAGDSGRAERRAHAVQVVVVHRQRMGELQPQRGRGVAGCSGCHAHPSSLPGRSGQPFVRSSSFSASMVSAT